MSSIYKIYDNLNLPIEESYNILRENIKFISSCNNIKTLTVTSCKPQEGKTTVAINLSIALARAGHKVLLLDADMRKPDAIKRLWSDSSLGITSYLNDEQEIEKITYETSIQNLYYISSGPKPSNPSELIASKKFRELVVQLKEQYDYVIVDTPAIGVVIDGIAIAAFTDGTILVVSPRTVDIRVATYLKAKLIDANANIIGVVLNKVDKREYKRYFENYNYFSDLKKIVKSKLRKVEKVKT